MSDATNQQQPPKPATTHTVTATAGEQFGLRHLKFNCPRCGVPLAIDDAGQWACHCGAVVDVQAPDGWAK